MFLKKKRELVYIKQRTVWLLICKLSKKRGLLLKFIADTE